jgi:hypothetical protein
MNAPLLAPPVARETLTPHDLVTYFRCPHELELAHVLRSLGPGAPPGEPPAVRTPANVVPLRRSGLEPPILPTLAFNEGRLDIFPSDELVYEDEGEVEELPMLFPPERVRADPIFRRHGSNLVDDELGLSGRPDLIVRRADGSFVPVEYKSTHPFRDLHAVHGRGFDLIQTVAECRLVEAVTGRRPPYGLLLYGDVAGDGEHEGWFQVPYGDREAGWVRYAVATIRGDGIRAPVPSERTCGSCPPHRDGRCRYAAVRYEGNDAPRDRFHAFR